MSEIECPACNRVFIYQQDVITVGANVQLMCEFCEADLLIQVDYIMEAWNPRVAEGGQL